MTMGRPKLEISRNKSITIRVTQFEFNKISRVANLKNLSKTDALIRGIDLLERDKPQKFKNISGSNKKISSANITDDDD